MASTEKTNPGLRSPGALPNSADRYLLFVRIFLGQLYFCGFKLLLDFREGFPILLGCTLVIGVATVVGSLAADIAYAVLDPRVHYGRA